MNKKNIVGSALVAAALATGQQAANAQAHQSVEDYKAEVTKVLAGQTRVNAKNSPELIVQHFDNDSTGKIVLSHKGNDTHATIAGGKTFGENVFVAGGVSAAKEGNLKGGSVFATAGVANDKHFASAEVISKKVQNKNFAPQTTHFQKSYTEEDANEIRQYHEDITSTTYKKYDGHSQTQIRGTVGKQFTPNFSGSASVIHTAGIRDADTKKFAWEVAGKYSNNGNDVKLSFDTNGKVTGQGTVKIKDNFSAYAGGSVNTRNGHDKTVFAGISYQWGGSKSEVNITPTYSTPAQKQMLDYMNGVNTASRQTTHDLSQYVNTKIETVLKVKPTVIRTPKITPAPIQTAKGTPLTAEEKPTYDLAGDNDGDGVSNEMELTHNTNPEDANSFPTAKGTPLTAEEKPTFDINSLEVPLQTEKGTPLTAEEKPTYDLAGDNDGDGVSNEIELEYNTNPEDPNSFPTAKGESLTHEVPTVDAETIQRMLEEVNEINRYDWVNFFNRFTPKDNEIAKDTTVLYRMPEWWRLTATDENTLFFRYANDLIDTIVMGAEIRWDTKMVMTHAETGVKVAVLANLSTSKVLWSRRHLTFTRLPDSEIEKIEEYNQLYNTKAWHSESGIPGDEGRSLEALKAKSLNYYVNTIVNEALWVYDIHVQCNNEWSENHQGHPYDCAADREEKLPKVRLYNRAQELVSPEIAKKYEELYLEKAIQKRRKDYEHEKETRWE